jgi:hypothetical protein
VNGPSQTPVRTSGRTRVLAVICGALALAFLALTDPFAPGGGDFHVKLTDEYYLARSSAYQIGIGADQWGHEPLKPQIPSMVIECAMDRHFILAKRQGLKRRSPGDPNDSFEIPAPGVFDYWILDTSVPQGFGPMNLSDFQAKRKELGVPDSVQLEKVTTFLPPRLRRP